MMQNVKKALGKYWGYDSFLPLQDRAMECVVAGRDCIVVLPTGGGKSLCFQAPAVTMRGMAVVVSPLISLMKDQVDALTECGVSAARIDSTQTLRERNAVFDRINNKALKLLYLSPERIFADGFIEFLKRIELSFFAVDEAHCVSMWGHDFRPEYQKLGLLKDAFPDVAIHAYTATATEPVRQDIARYLRLKNPEELIGSFDRPNLVYKVERRTDKLTQLCDVLDRHKGESGIIYCIRRADVDELCAKLAERGYQAVSYHAGMKDHNRKENQDAFIEDRVEIIIATIAFGMGIDKPNVRYVVHTGMPKTIEHYQQESGRAGRDGLEAECCLFYSGADYGIWKSIMGAMEPDAKEISIRKLNDIYRYCTGVMCRHRAILNYFGQDTAGDNCAACDVCLGGLDCMEESQVVGQKILSCIVRLEERFGGDYTASVLIGSRDQRILENGHETLSTYGILAEFAKRVVRDWIEQLAAQGCIQKTGEYNVLRVTQKGWSVLKGEDVPRLLKPAKSRPKISKAVKDSWEGVDSGLFDLLRKLRMDLAHRKGVPAYIVFGDAALRDMARRKPSTTEEFLEVNGVGEKKCKEFGPAFLAVIKEHSR
ncbi:MAG: DNA helicase RecQ [Candidatus Aureabacteria bacterium]|nr:DNA helicase RecQ [Candidatus Auribacterota bacterium]